MPASNVQFKALPNQAAIDYLKNKVPAASASWDSWIAPVHAKSFTVAGAPSIEFATDMHEAIVKAIKEGLTITDFRKDFDQVVQKYGWSYHGSRGWRSDVIFRTNMRTAHMAAKWKQIQENKDIAPYLEYVSVLDGRTTTNCKKWDGLILPVDDQFWSVYYPPNHWHCRATVRQISATTLKREGKVVSDPVEIKRSDVVVKYGKNKGEVIPNVPHGVDPGWDYNVGEAWIAPDVSLGKKLANLPPTMAGYAYQNMVTEPFIQSVNNAWRSFKSDIVNVGRPQNRSQFVGFTSHTIQQGLSDNAAKIIAKTEQINSARALNPKNNLPLLAKPDLNPENLAIIAPDFKVNHLVGTHKSGSLSQWDASFIDDLPALLHDYQAVLYDVDAQALVYVTKKQSNGRYATAYVNINQRKKNMDTTNWVKSLNNKPLATLKESRFILIDGSLPEK